MSTSPLVFRDILVPYERAVRKPLPSWIAEVREGVAYWQKKLEPDLPQATAALVSCFNQAALIEVHFGRKGHARELCVRALRWVWDLARQSRNIDCYKSGFQPFVNLARLDRINGAWTEALARLDTVSCALRGEAADLDGLRVSEEELDLILNDTSLRSALQNACMIDRLKTLLKAGMFARIPDIVWPLDRPLQQFVVEAQEIAFCCTGQLDRALACTKDWLCYFPDADQTVVLFRMAETLAASRQHERALEALRQLSRLFLRSRTRLGHDGLTLLNRLAVVLRTSILLRHLGAVTESRELAWLGYEQAVRLDDVLLKCEFLQALQNTGVQELEGQEISSAIRIIRQQAWYGCAQASACSATESATLAADVLFNALTTLSEEVLPAAFHFPRAAPVSQPKLRAAADD